jgi:hypothetical protein
MASNNLFEQVAYKSGKYTAGLFEIDTMTGDVIVSSRVPRETAPGQHTFSDCFCYGPDGRLVKKTRVVVTGGSGLVQSVFSDYTVPVVARGSVSHVAYDDNVTQILGNSRELGTPYYSKSTGDVVVKSIDNRGLLGGTSPSGVISASLDGVISDFDLHAEAVTRKVATAQDGKYTVTENGTIIYHASDNNMRLHHPRAGPCGSCRHADTLVAVSLQDHTNWLSLGNYGVQTWNGTTHTSPVVALPNGIKPRTVTAMAVTPKHADDRLVCVAHVIDDMPAITVFDMKNNALWVQLDVPSPPAGARVKSVALVRNTAHTAWFVKALLDDGTSPAWKLPLLERDTAGVVVKPLKGETDEGVRALAVVQKAGATLGQLHMTQGVNLDGTHAIAAVWVPPEQSGSDA